MRKLIIILPAVLIFSNSISQNVGIGITAPVAKLHVVNPGSAILELGNSGSLNSNINSELLFKTGGFYTGIIGTYGTGINTSRLGFSTFASSNPDNLSERMSILDNGNVGINTTSPSYKLDINGSIHGSSNLLVDGNAGFGTLNPTAKLEVVGTLKVNGSITRPATGSSNLIPYAFGTIASNGSYAGTTTGNLTVTKSANEPGLYLIDLSPDSFPWSNRHLYTIVATLDGSTPGTINAVLVPEQIMVHTTALTQSGTLVQADQPFYIVIFRRQ